MRSPILLLVLAFFVAGSNAQIKTAPTPASVPARPTLDRGVVEGRTYTNKQFGFDVTFPDEWLIPGDDFEDYMKRQGIDLSLKAPDSLAPASRAKINRAPQRVTVLLTAYRSMPGTADNATARISVEDLSADPQIKDAVDYFDAMRVTFASMRLPADFKYSETRAEKLGTHQFGYLDTSSKDGQKRMYATVRGGYAVLFTLTYSRASDLETFREVISSGNFSLR